MGRPLQKTDCDELLAYVHKRNISCTRNLLDALQAHHGAKVETDQEEAEPEPDPEPALIVIGNRIEQIKKLVCRQFNVSRSSIESNSRKKGVVYPRQIVMYLARKHTTHSYPEIGRRLGGRDHTTIMHAFNKIDGLIRQDNKISEEVAQLEAAMS